MNRWQGIVGALGEQGVHLVRSTAQTIGGDGFSAGRAESIHGPVFLKTCGAGDFARLAAEAEGLAELAKAQAIRVPQVLALVQAGSMACLALEWLALESPGRGVAAQLGRALAALHRCTQERFGWHRDNTIGLTPQVNTPDDDWVRFWRDRRLGYQLELAAGNGYGGELQQAGSRLLANLERLLAGHAPEASLLHGDLWGGNFAAVGGRPVIFDPAVYYGDRETDLAMTRLFGGFGQDFYEAYETAWPLPPGHEQRLLLYQLYHVLNHLNLFGSGYGAQALEMMRRLNKAL